MANENSATSHSYRNDRMGGAGRGNAGNQGTSGYGSDSYYDQAYGTGRQDYASGRGYGGGMDPYASGQGPFGNPDYGTRFRRAEQGWGAGQNQDFGNQGYGMGAQGYYGYGMRRRSGNPRYSMGRPYDYPEYGGQSYGFGREEYGGPGYEMSGRGYEDDRLRGYYGEQGYGMGREQSAPSYYGNQAYGVRPNAFGPEYGNAGFFDWTWPYGGTVSGERYPYGYGATERARQQPWREDNWQQNSFQSGHEVGPHVGRGPKNYQRPDERIKEDVNDRLTQNSQIDATNVSVSVASGIVTLTGSVESRVQKRIAEDIAESVQGVMDVHNQLRVDQQAVNIGQAPTQTATDGTTAH